MGTSIEIEPMRVRLCPDCFGAFRTDKGCAMCGSEREPVVYWSDENGDTLFQLVSDKRESSV
jgi:hypothetical protein